MTTIEEDDVVARSESVREDESPGAAREIERQSGKRIADIEHVFHLGC